MPAQLAADRDAIQLRYLNLGYETATVDVKPASASDGTRADVLFDVREGPQVFVDHVHHRRQRADETETIERELQLKPAIRSAARRCSRASGG